MNYWLLRQSKVSLSHLSMALNIPFCLWIRHRCLQLDTSGLALSTVLKRIIVLVSQRACNTRSEANHLCVLPRNVQIRDRISEAMPSIPTHSDITCLKPSFTFWSLNDSCCYLILIPCNTFDDLHPMYKRFCVNTSRRLFFSCRCKGDIRELFLLYIITLSNKILHIHLLSGDHALYLALVLFDISELRAWHSQPCILMRWIDGGGKVKESGFLKHFPWILPLFSAISWIFALALSKRQIFNQLGKWHCLSFPSSSPSKVIVQEHDIEPDGFL